MVGAECDEGEGRGQRVKVRGYERNQREAKRRATCILGKYIKRRCAEREKKMSGGLKKVLACSVVTTNRGMSG